MTVVTVGSADLVPVDVDEPITTAIAYRIIAGAAVVAVFHRDADDAWAVCEAGVDTPIAVLAHDDALALGAQVASALAAAMAAEASAAAIRAGVGDLAVAAIATAAAARANPTQEVSQ